MTAPVRANVGLPPPVRAALHEADLAQLLDLVEVLSLVDAGLVDAGLEGASRDAQQLAVERLGLRCETTGR